MGFNGTGREHGEGHGAAGSIEDSGVEVFEGLRFRV